MLKRTVVGRFPHEGFGRWPASWVKAHAGRLFWGPGGTVWRCVGAGARWTGGGRWRWVVRLRFRRVRRWGAAERVGVVDAAPAPGVRVRA